MCFLSNLSNLQEPPTYSQACKKPEWVEAMHKKLTVLEHNQTWEIMDLPHGRKTIGSKWVYRIKTKPDGTMDRYKARLMAKGYHQVHGIDYLDSFSPVAKMVTVRILIAVAIARAWPLYQLDINNAFLHGYLDKEVCMLPPEGYLGTNPG